jgi:hypothetical protein
MVTNYGKLRGKVDRLWVHSCPTMMAEEGGLLGMAHRLVKLVSRQTFS